MKNQSIGVALFAHPSVLEENGSSSIEGVESPYSVNGPHYFVTIVDNNNSLVIVPCFSKPGFGRVEVPTSARKGHPSWSGKPCFINFQQLWLTSFEALSRAAQAANDKSTPHKPNIVDPKWLKSAWRMNFISNAVH